MFLRPNYFVDGDITDLNIKMLVDDGIKGLMLDLDSTLMAPKAGSLTQEAEAWLKDAKGHLKLVILSNNKRADYLEKVEKELDLHVIGHAAKPFKSGFEKALTHLKLSKEEVAVVGDRALTDILGGKLFDIRTILVMPLKSITEPSIKNMRQEYRKKSYETLKLFYIVTRVINSLLANSKLLG